MPSPLHLTFPLDTEIDVVLASAAAPLPVEQHEIFRHHVARLLQGCEVLGPGVVYRAAAQAQRALFDPPDLSRTNGSTKYG
jgi:hypothetical protein